MKVLVTISNSAPYGWFFPFSFFLFPFSVKKIILSSFILPILFIRTGIPDAATLMRSFFPNKNIDYISPQLYESGEEGSNSYVTGAGVQWTEYAACKAAVIPSIVQASYYNSAKSYFAGKGVTTKGYIQWKQV
jgi:hypothetical protein